MNEQIVGGGAFVSCAAGYVQPLLVVGQFTGEPGSGAEARLLMVKFLQQLEAEWLAAVGGRKRDDLLLVVSELVTNAERHSGGPYLLELEGTDRQVTVTVYDSSAILPCRFERDPSRLGGHASRSSTRCATGSRRNGSPSASGCGRRSICEAVVPAAAAVHRRRPPSYPAARFPGSGGAHPFGRRKESHGGSQRA